MFPAASVSGLYFGHPESRYFSVDMITKDQVEAYAARKGMPVAEVERCSGSQLDPEVANAFTTSIESDRAAARAAGVEVPD